MRDTMTFRRRHAGYAPLPVLDFLARLRLWRALRRERAALTRLDPRLLRDIGVTGADAGTEAARPFWDAPAGRF